MSYLAAFVLAATAGALWKKYQETKNLIGALTALDAYGPTLRAAQEYGWPR